MKLPKLPSFRRSALEQLKRGDWRRSALPFASGAVPTMLMGSELRLLRFLTERHWQVEGIIIDAGCFLGGSTVALASGARANLARRGMAELPLIHSFDLFRVEDYTRAQFFPGRQVGESFRMDFDRNIAPFAPLIAVHEGDITAFDPPDAPIEILFVDVAKSEQVCDWITTSLFPRLIPGRSIVIQQDFLWREWNGWLQVTMEFYSDQFELLCDTGRNSAVFQFTRPFASGHPQAALIQSLDCQQKKALMENAAARFPPEQAAILRASAAHYLALLAGQPLS